MTSGRPRCYQCTNDCSRVTLATRSYRRWRVHRDTRMDCHKKHLTSCTGTMNSQPCTVAALLFRAAAPRRQRNSMLWVHSRVPSAIGASNQSDHLSHLSTSICQPHSTQKTNKGSVHSQKSLAIVGIRSSSLKMRRRRRLTDSSTTLDFKKSIE